LLIFGLDFFVTDNDTRGLQGKRDNKPESATDLAVVVDLEEVLDVVPMDGKEAAQVVDATDHLVHVDVVDGNELVSIEETQKNGGKKPIMHTFFEPVAGGCCGMSEWGHHQLVKAWEASWQARGWETRILTKKDAENHPDFDMLQKKLHKVGVGGYNQRCYWRWLAMVTAGGGWMSDYDVFPLGLDSEVGLEIGEDDTFKSFYHNVPCLLHASAKEWDRIIHLMIGILPPKQSGNEVISDMISLKHLGQWKGRAGMEWTGDVQTHIFYERNEEGDLRLNCKVGKAKLAVHLSHHECDIAFREGRYPEIEKMPKDVHQAIERRSDAALKLMTHYKDKCIDME